MKISQKGQKIKLNQVMDISVDVHKDILNFFLETGDKEYSDECNNRTAIITKRLEVYYKIAIDNGMKTLRIICEPTGQYHNKLFRTARKMGFFTCFVNAESVARFRVIETNDTGKTDTKDPRVIRTLGQLDKMMKHRMIGKEYMILRKLNKVYDDVDENIVRLRCRLDRLLVDLFCDYSFKKDFLYTASGLGLIEAYGCNPYRIIKAGYEEFCVCMRQVAPRIRKQTLERLWEDAQSSVFNEQPEGYVDTMEMNLYQLIGDWIIQVKRKEDLVRKMKETLNHLREDDPGILPSTPGVINDKNMARLLEKQGRYPILPTGGCL